MGGICKQDSTYWRPVSTDDCQRIPCVCVLLMGGKGGFQVLSDAGMMYTVKDGRMVLQPKD